MPSELTPVNVADAFAELEIKHKTVAKIYCNRRQLSDLIQRYGDAFFHARYDPCYQSAKYTWEERWISWLPWPKRKFSRGPKNLSEQQGWIFKARVFYRGDVPNGSLILVCAEEGIEHIVPYVIGAGHG